MKDTTTLVLLGMVLEVVVALVGWVALFPTRAEAQTGNNAVYDSLGNCAPCKKSPAFIDASVFGGSSTDICSVLNNVLVNIVQSTYPQGAVIDARGLPAVGTSMTCPSSQPSQWAGIAHPPPSTILLPATTPAAPIKIPSMWALPPNTHLIGEGDTISSTTTISTTIQAHGSFPSSSMIQFGTSLAFCFPPGSSVCNDISVENLTLDGQGQAINGIVNPYAQDQSYVNHVSLYQILGTGLLVSPGAGCPTLSAHSAERVGSLRPDPQGTNGSNSYQYHRP
jgi:hypothetical protein